MSASFRMEDGYAPAESANPVRDNHGDAFFRTAVHAGHSLPVAGVLVVAGILYLVEHRRLKKGR